MGHTFARVVSHPNFVLSWQAATTLHAMLDHLFFAMILAQIQPLKDVAVPWLQVHGKGPFSLAAPLIHVPDKYSMLSRACQSNMPWLALHSVPDEQH